jgi:hypothetical protein
MPGANGLSALKSREDARLSAEIQTIFLDHRQVYGSPRIHAALQTRGIRCGRKRVVRLMQALGLQAKRHRHHSYPLALHMALARRHPQTGLLHHSDRGTEYTSHGYQALLAELGIAVSMSRTANCYDNAAMESFFDTLKSECVERTQFLTLAQARSAIFEYLECFEVIVFQVSTNLGDGHSGKALAVRGYHPFPLRRIYIPKSNGGQRPLSMPTMRDRAMQALYLLALDPVSETTADPNSYGFRRGRGTADAIEACFIALCQKDRAQWILEGDIRSCFDRISTENRVLLHPNCHQQVHSQNLHVEKSRPMKRAEGKA